ncbi:MAG: alpha-amylase [Nocardioides sp.]
MSHRTHTISLLLPLLRRTSRRRRFAVWSTALATLGSLMLVAGNATAEPGARSQPAASAAAGRASSDVLANLWHWNWPSVAKECTDVLGPAGYGGVQVSPPQDSLKRTELGNGSDTILHPWWEVYQPASYQLNGRMGTPRQFKEMVRTCRKAGVKVYVDVIINHMTGQGSLSYSGVSYERYSYDGLYGEENFHKFSGDCPSASGGIEDFNNQQQVFKCELLGLADLRTDTPAVRRRLVGYLNTLLDIGVSGFRVDAAKHVGQDDLDAIYAGLKRTKEGTRPYWALEVFGGGPGTLSPFAFTRSGSVLGLDGVKQLRDAFKSYTPDQVGSIATLEEYGEGSGLTPGDKTLVFVQNHDTERNGDALSYKDGARNVLANIFTLAADYGRPQVYAGFEWETRDDSPPSDTEGIITDTDCDKGWACVNRELGVRNMVGWHNYVGSARRANWWDDGGNVIAFSRGNKGWIALNNGPEPATIEVRTGLPRGTYCDIIHSERTDGACTGPTVTVGASGVASVTVPATDAVAFDRRDRQ